MFDCTSFTDTSTEVLNSFRTPISTREAETSLATSDIETLLARIAHCRYEAEVLAITSRAVALLGGEAFVFTTLLQEDIEAGRVSYRFMLGCNPAWGQMYVNRKWFMNDPMLDYARKSSAPRLLRDLAPGSESQRAILNTAAVSGFHQAMIVPAHSGAASRMGMLLVGVPDVGAGEARLWRNRVMLRALAMELLDWWIERLREDAVVRFSLKDIELRILELQSKGFIADDIAVELGVSSRTIYKRIRQIKDKLGARDIGSALRLADSYGLFSA